MVVLLVIVVAVALAVLFLAVNVYRLLHAADRDQPATLLGGGSHLSKRRK